MPVSTRILRRRALRPAGSALIFALAIILALAVVGVALIRIAGGDRISAGQLGAKDRGLACAEAGLQYARRFYGSTYDTSNQWNTYLTRPTTGTPSFRYDPNANDPTPDSKPDLSSCRTSPSSCPVPIQALGYSDGNVQHLDPGADIDGDGVPDFWVSVHDDDDEQPIGHPNNPSHDNNETIIIRSECINPNFATTVSGRLGLDGLDGGTGASKAQNAVIESVLLHVQGSSGYAAATSASNASDLVGAR